MKLPIAKQLKKQSQVQVAFLQDEIMDILYSLTDELIFHGGTAIWRCYNGKRFSEDLDFYSRSFPRILTKFQKSVMSHGLSVLKIKDTGNVIFSSIKNNNAIVGVEVNHVFNATGNQIAYELTDGSHIEVLSLTADQFIEEKMLAYADRRYIRDIYDIYHLSTNYELQASTRLNLMEFLSNLPSPIDEHVLRTLVYTGLAPTFENMIREMKRHIR
ncbi:MAG: nucleotidyl transferase AbiEii/AbiGii toxin family protein [Thermoplasmatales archaeon]|nr:nucleotidyl transferase AbiEii/AbiGii toxin family protein [Thermoplasmatales archaeon]MCW6170074.1 nucleotidyl transferase AbiEii/AbiGii toxin family protein [Thermoplasmatales archaeon]